MTLFTPAVCQLLQGPDDSCGAELVDPALVLLDLDGTLIDSVPDLSAAVDVMLIALGRAPAGAEQVANWIGNGADMLVRRALCDGNEAHALALSDQDLRIARTHFDQAYLAALHQATGVFTGVAEFLQNVPLPKVIITNKPRMFTEPLIASLGWTGLFSFLICGDDFSEKKPSPTPLLKACEKLAVPVNRTIMIGDSRHDIQAAKAAEIASIAVSYGYNHGDAISTSNPDLICDNLMDLLRAQ